MWACGIGARANGWEEEGLGQSRGVITPAGED